MADKLKSLVHELVKIKTTVDNKKQLIEQLDAKIEKANLVKEKAKATLPIYQRQLDTGLVRVKEMFPKHEASLIRDIKIADNSEKRARAIRQLNYVRNILNLPPMDFENSFDTIMSDLASDDPKIET